VAAGELAGSAAYEGFFVFDYASVRVVTALLLGAAVGVGGGGCGKKEAAG
jgi:hypothetical protein